jgi:hypothetical protein
MKRFTPVASGLVVAVLALPSAAAAHSKPSVSSVREHIRGADQALATVTNRVQRHDQAAAAIAIVKNLRQTQTAARESGRIRGASKQATALRLVAAQRDTNVQTLTGLVDDVGEDLQVDIATAITSNLTGRETAIAKLTALAPRLPAAAQAGIARAIAAISAHGDQTVSDLTTAINSGEIGAAAQPRLQQALKTASGAMFTGVNQLQKIAGMLPPQAQGPVSNAIARVTGILQSIFGNGTPANTTDAPPSTTATPGGKPANLPIPTNLPIPCGLPIPSFLPFARPC